MKHYIYLALACIFLPIILLGGCDMAPPFTHEIEIRFHSNNDTDRVIVQSVQPEQRVLLQPNAFIHKGYSFAGWMATEPDGTHLDFMDEQELIVGNKTIDLYANWKAVEENELLQSTRNPFPGSVSGLVFYDKRYYSDGWRYLEMAPASTEWTAEWGAQGYLVKGENRVSREFPPWAQENSIYGGALNTEQIIKYYNNLVTIYPGRGDYYTNPDQYPTGYVRNNIKVVGDGSVAAKNCLDFVYNDCDDWYLPSMQELSLFTEYYGSSNPDSLKPEKYWSSNQINEGVAGSYNRADLYNQTSLKFEKLLVRAMRAF